MLIKLLLLACIGAFGVLAMRGAQSATRRALWRLAGLAVLAGGALSVVYPDALTWVAHKMGIGRGADLLLYTMAVTFLVVVAALFRRIAELESRYVILARSIALGHAESSAPPAEPERTRPTIPAA